MRCAHGCRVPTRAAANVSRTVIVRFSTSRRGRSANVVSATNRASVRVSSIRREVYRPGGAAGADTTGRDGAKLPARSCAARPARERGGKEPMSGDLCFSTAVELARRIRAREVSVTEVLQAHLAQIARVNPKVNAIVTLTAHRALR